MKQSKKESLAESCINTASGFVLGVLITVFFTYVDTGILYLGDKMDPHEIIVWTSIMTIVSVLRSYLWRRFFNAEIHRLMHRFFTKSQLEEDIYDR